ncbi:helix-turn-helix domain-containing protein [Gordonia hydrophobica]|uniref:helix-turn-helix domain-containing protein n=1 Tax=Gordonia hydrophobica TaxID=40516 RepID=UPI001956B165|nr:helix-turn-helix domain-containing protein [Gordonia hydrophobica]MBM7368883.1 hypothetical protein [Gordonia hydrophobica]
MKERVVCTPRDIGYGDAPIMVRWNKIRWRCVNSECARGSFTEAIGQVPRRRRTTTRLRETIGRAIGDAARSVAEVAAGHGVSWHTAHGAFVDIAATALTDPAPTSVLGIDETRRGKPRWVRGGDGRWVRIDPWDTGFVDLAGDQGLLGQVTGRTSAVVIDWLAAQPAPFRDAIEYVAIDPAASYAAAVAVGQVPDSGVTGLWSFVGGQAGSSINGSVLTSVCESVSVVMVSRHRLRTSRPR